VLVQPLRSLPTYPTLLTCHTLIMASVEDKVEEDRAETPAPPQGYQYVHIDAAVQKRVVRKLDWNLLPLVVVLCKPYLLPSYRLREDLSYASQISYPSSTAPTSVTRRLPA
jgi:hypothetical protein